EMWLQLQSQILQLRLGQLGLELRGGELLRLRQPEFPEVVVQTDDAREADEIVRKLHRITIEHDAVVVATESEQRRKNLARDGHEIGMRERKSNTRRKMTERHRNPIQTPRAEEIQIRSAEHQRWQNERGIN